MSFQPIIKWSGSKRSQCERILSYFPKNIDTFYEPFVGGGSVMRALLESDINVNKIVCSDLNSDLINLWNVVKKDHKYLIERYAELWYELNKDDDPVRRNLFYQKIRKRLNEKHSPFDFNFVMRNAINGMPRYNRNGNFNSAFHFSRKGISPSRFAEIVKEWHNLLNRNDITFLCQDFGKVCPSKDDFVYLDPPYIASRGMYFGNFDFERFWGWLKAIPCSYLLSFDGSCGKNSPVFSIPSSLYTKHLLINSGKSSFRRLINSVKDNKNESVFESLYLKTID